MSKLDAFVLVSGLSGAGKTTALSTLSDLGFYTVDNLPVPLFNQFLELAQSAPRRYKHTALLMDIDSREKLTDLMQDIAKFPTDTTKPFLLFLDATPDKIVTRYSETRRPHPGFNPERDKTLLGAIERERNRLAPLKEIANLVINTTNLSVHDLRREIRNFVSSLAPKENKNVRINFLSFGFKYGLPIDCDIVADVRFLPNPYFVAELRDHTGKDQAVSDFVMNQPEAEEFIRRYLDLLKFLVPKYIHEGKAYINIGIGCTGGKHRSVVIADKLAGLIAHPDCLVSVQHRDVGR